MSQPSNPPEIEGIPSLIPDEDANELKFVQAHHREFFIPSRTRPRNFPTRAIPSGLQRMCLEITSSFEGVDGFASICGDFDKQGLSLGALQQCLGQGSLQPLLIKMRRDHPQLLHKMWGAAAVAEFDELIKKTRRDQVRWGRSISEPPRYYRVTNPWKIRLQEMARTPVYITFQLEASNKVFAKALNICREWGLHSQRAVVFAFDTCTQQGGISRRHAKRINAFIEAKTAKLGRALTEVEKMLCITQGRTSYSKVRWQADVLARRYAIILGRSQPFAWRGRQYSGRVHGSKRHIDKEFGLSDAPWNIDAVPLPPLKGKKCITCGKPA